MHVLVLFLSRLLRHLRNLVHFSERLTTQPGCKINYHISLQIFLAIDRQSFITYGIQLRIHFLGKGSKRTRNICVTCPYILPSATYGKVMFHKHVSRILPMCVCVYTHPLPNACWDTPPGQPPLGSHPPADTPWRQLQWSVRILLECILVSLPVCTGYGRGHEPLPRSDTSNTSHIG